MGFEKALVAVKVMKDRIQYRSQSLLNLARDYFSMLAIQPRRHLGSFECVIFLGKTASGTSPLFDVGFWKRLLVALNQLCSKALYKSRTCLLRRRLSIRHQRGRRPRQGPIGRQSPVYECFLSSHLKPQEWVIFCYFQNKSRNCHFLRHFDPPKKLRRKVFNRHQFFSQTNNT